MGENESKLLHADLTYEIRGVLFHVGNHLWLDLPEGDFQKAVSIALTKRNKPHTLEEQFHVYRRAMQVELNEQNVSLREMSPAFDVRMRRYLSHFDKKLGLLANFHGERLSVRPVRIS